MTSLSARFTSDFYVQLDLLVDDEYQLDRVAGMLLIMRIMLLIMHTVADHAHHYPNTHIHTLLQMPRGI